MAIATNGGHISRALDFYKLEGKYFIVGGTTPWSDETHPDPPSISDFKLIDVIGLKKVENTYLVIPTTETEDVISYRDGNWKKVVEEIKTTVGAEGVTINSTVVPVSSVSALTVGSKVRVANIYEGTIQSISGLYITLDTPAPVAISPGSTVLGGAMVEGAKYVYLECHLNYDEFPITDPNTGSPLSYRQLGLCTKVTPNDRDILKSALYSETGVDEYTSLGTLEIIDNRVPSSRDISQREKLSLIIEF